MTSNDKGDREIRCAAHTVTLIAVDGLRSIALDRLRSRIKEEITGGHLHARNYKHI